MMADSAEGLLSLWGERWFDYTVSMLWQSASVIGVVWVVARLARNRSASFRYAMWMLVLLRLVLPTGISSPIGLGTLGSQMIQRFAPPDSVSAPGEVVSFQVPERTERLHAQTAKNGVVRTPNLAVVPQAAWNIEGPTVTAKKSPVTAFNDQGASLLPALFLIWAAGVLLFAILILFRFGRLLRLVSSAEPVSSGPLHELFLRCCERAPARTFFFPTLFSSPSLSSPAVTGILRPRIVLPKTFIESSPQTELEPLILHELAHVRRWDILLNWTQVVLQITYWYNPLVWVANRQIRREREQACDDLVLVATGLRRKEYGSSLLKIVQMAPRRPSLSLGLVGVIEPRDSLTLRLKKIMDTRRKISARLTVLSLACVFIIGAVVLPAQPAREKASEYLGQLRDPERDMKELAEAVYGLSTSANTLGPTETEALRRLILSLQIKGGIARVLAEYPVVNLARNGDFEIGLETPAFWKQQSSGGSELAWDSEESYWGRGSASVEVSGEGYGRWVQEAGVPTECESVLVSAFLKARQAGMISVRLEFLVEDADGPKWVSGANPAVPLAAEPGAWFTCDWQLCQSEVSVPGGSTRMRVVLECANHGKAWFDNVSIHPRPRSSAEERGQDEEAEFQVYPEGYVYDAWTKQPIEGAIVLTDLATSIGHVTERRPITVTDERGRFEFGENGVPSKAPFLVVWHPEYRKRCLPFDADNVRSLEFLLEPVGGTILSGTVYINGVPFEEPITVQLRSVEGGGVGKGQSFEGGVYRFAHMPHGMMRVSVRAEGLPQTYTAIVNAAKDEEVVQDFHIYLPEDYSAAVHVSGTVLDAETGEPIPGAEVGFDRDFSHGPCVSDAEGRFRTSEPAVRKGGDIQLFVWRHGYLNTSATVDVSNDLHGDIENVALRLVAR
jgi:beta-lactamase regulating signal transducer with metallopeptidase domain